MVRLPTALPSVAGKKICRIVIALSLSQIAPMIHALSRGPAMAVPISAGAATGSRVSDLLSVVEVPGGFCSHEVFPVHQQAVITDCCLDGNVVD